MVCYVWFASGSNSSAMETLMALFHLHGTVRFGKARYGTVWYGSVRVGLHLHCSLVPLLSGRDYSRAVIIALPLLP